MTNKEALNRFDQAHNAKIDKLIWIAGLSNDDKALNEFIEGIRSKDIEKCLPDVYADDNFNDYFNDNSLSQLLYLHNKFGLLAEVHIPEARGFHFDKAGKPMSWSTGGISTLVYLYAETLEELLQKVELAGEEEFQYAVKKAKELSKKKDKIK